MILVNQQNCTTNLITKLLRYIVIGLQRVAQWPRHCNLTKRFSVCVMCVLVLHPFMFHSSRGSEQDLYSKCESKWNNFIIVLWTTISAMWGSNMKTVIQMGIKICLGVYCRRILSSGGMKKILTHGGGTPIFSQYGDGGGSPSRENPDLQTYFLFKQLT